MKAILLELNEVNFSFIEKYIERGELPNFAEIFKKYSYTTTIAENEYENLEPWIQWVTVHTGKSYAEHGIFRLGDAAASDLSQIWEVLEDKYNISVAAISPMNAAANAKETTFFMPDPWSSNVVVGTWDLKLLFAAAKVAVNNNAEGKISLSAFFQLAISLIPNFRFKNLPKYFSLVLASRKRKWFKAIFLDRILMDTFYTKWRKYKPEFSSLFLNAAAHIQHHYMYNSSVYEGENQNPSWYVERNVDPLLDIYREYDEMLGSLGDFPNTRIFISTALSQVPNPVMTYQYRLNNHADFLNRLSIKYENVFPRMSRDFLITFANSADALKAQKVLQSVENAKGDYIFSVDNRGDDLFCKINYYGPAEGLQQIKCNDQTIEDFAGQVSLASIENGIHTTTGYFVDTGVAADQAEKQIPLTDIYKKIVSVYS